MVQDIIVHIRENKCEKNSRYRHSIFTGPESFFPWEVYKVDLDMHHDVMFLGKANRWGRVVNRALRKKSHTGRKNKDLLYIYQQNMV